MKIVLWENILEAEILAERQSSCIESIREKVENGHK